MDVFRRSVSWWVLLLAVLILNGCSSRMNLSHASTQLDVGVRAARQNLWREALFRFQRAVQIEPTDSMAHNNLAVAYEGIGDFERARAEYVEALRLDRSNQYIQKNYSRFVEFTSKNKKRQRSVDSKDAPPAPQPSPSANPPIPDATTPAPPPTTPPPSNPPSAAAVTGVSR
jgi:Tfp pilus assembly protein PilF